MLTNVTRPLRAHAVSPVASVLLRSVICIMRRRIFRYVANENEMMRPSHAHTLPFLFLRFFFVSYPVVGFVFPPGVGRFGKRANFPKSGPPGSGAVFQLGLLGWKKGRGGRRGAIHLESFVAPTLQECCFPSVCRASTARAHPFRITNNKLNWGAK